MNDLSAGCPATTIQPARRTGRAPLPSPSSRPVESHCATVKRELHILCFSGGQINPAKTFQFLDGAIDARVSVMHVEFDYFRA